ncbi:MAG: ribose-5-phosphate isomerase [Pseudomonadota bacterium]|jgi:ribose 5-phosphate isomerase A
MQAREMLKKAVAQAALSTVPDRCFLGVGSGTTMEYFVQLLPTIRSKIEACVPSSEKIATLLRAHQLPVIELTAVPEVHLYIDGADACNASKELIKGKGGALTREKILAQCANEFICLIDSSKLGKRFLEVSISVEVIPMARSVVARMITQLGGKPRLREQFITDNGNEILDIDGLPLNRPLELERSLKSIIGVVESGIFAQTRPNQVLVSNSDYSISVIQ